VILSLNLKIGPIYINAHLLIQFINQSFDPINQRLGEKRQTFNKQKTA